MDGQGRPGKAREEAARLRARGERGGGQGAEAARLEGGRRRFANLAPADPVQALRAARPLAGSVAPLESNRKQGLSQALTITWVKYVNPASVSFRILAAFR